MKQGATMFAKRSGGTPRGLALQGPTILSYGFRPFFLGAGIFAIISMVLWICALIEGWPLGGDSYGALYWHAHELLFGYGGAALAGFMLTAIPNWTGRLPVSGLPLLGLLLLWLAGRIVMLSPDYFGVYPAAAVEAAFFPTLAILAAIEIIAGHNWKNLKIVLALIFLSTVNLAFHALVVTGSDPQAILRAGISGFVMLVAIVGGRMVPSFTRNWLAKAGPAALPSPFDRIDRVSLVSLAAALGAWTIVPEHIATVFLCGGAAILHGYRWSRWLGWRTWREPLLLQLHLAYGFLPIGLALMALAAWGTVSPFSALHVLTVGVIGNMTLAVMTRATLGHTGRSLVASRRTTTAYAALVLATLLRPLAELVPEHYQHILAVSGACWIAAFTLFVFEYGPFLLAPRLTPTGRSGLV
jgi:uncharacterized protein involved in response to NO